MKIRVNFIEFNNCLYDKDGHEYYIEELDLTVNHDYWENLKHQYVGQFMQASISSSNYIDVSEEAMADASLRIATALVEKLKNE